jgi:selenoprotein W-related protein
VVEEVLDRFMEDIGSFTLVPSHGGVFDVEMDGRVIFRKADTGRFPKQGEIAEAVSQALSARN